MESNTESKSRLHPNEESLPRRADILGVGISVTDYAEVVRCVLAAAERGQNLLVAAADVHMLMQAHHDPAFSAVLNAFAIVVPDGQPVRWGLRLVREADLAERVYGPTLMLKVCAAAARAGLPIFLYGSRPEVLARLERRLPEQFHGLQIAGSIAGRFRPLSPAEQEQDARAVGDSGARITFVGMGCPRQEWWAFHMRSRIQMPLLAVGAAFDFHAGLVSQAPAWMQSRGLEWLYRLGTDPRRLWRRYVLLTPRYLPLITLQALGAYRFPHHTDLGQALVRACPG